MCQFGPLRAGLYFRPISADRMRRLQSHPKISLKTESLKALNGAGIDALIGRYYSTMMNSHDFTATSRLKVAC